MASRTKDTGPTPQQMSDGITNVVTGLGTLRDPRTHNAYFTRVLTDREIYAAYAGSWLMTKIVNKPATEMVRAWRDWQAEDDQIAAIEKYERKLNLRAKVRQAEVLRGLGGCGMVLWIGNENPALPINPRTLTLDSLRGIHVWHRSRFTLEDMETDPASDWYGQPKFYRMGSRDGRQLRLHPSRVIPFRAQEIPDIIGVAWQDAFWGMSTVQIVMDAVQNSDTSQNSFAAMFKDARNRRIGIPGMTNMLATAEGEKILTARMAAVSALESMLGVTFYDSGEDGKNGEEIDDRQMTWAGIPDINNNYLAIVAAACDMPATILLGKSPDGMNATGAGDTEAWEKTVKARQDLDLRPCLEQLDAVMIPSATGQADEDIYFDFAPLSVPNEKDEATTFKMMMDAVVEAQSLGSIPEPAFSKGVQNLFTERGWLPGLDAALGEIPEDERFPDPGDDLTDPNLVDPNAVPEPDPNATPRRQAANDRKRWALLDAEPRTLYVRRDVVNKAEIAKWAKSQGFTDIVPDLHVTIAYSTTPIDWMKAGTSWSSKLEIGEGGPRLVEGMGPEKDYKALLFTADELVWRNQTIRDAGASWGWPEYQPHITIQIGGDVDLSTVEPYQGKITLGPEIFEEVRTGDDA